MSKINCNVILPARHACPAGYMFCLRLFLFFNCNEFSETQSSQDLPDHSPIFTLWLIVHYRSDLFFRSLKGRCHGNRRNRRNRPIHLSFVTLAFRNGLEYRTADGRINSGDDLATPLKNLVNLGLVTSEFTHQHTLPVEQQWQCD